jgi:hypothetical protein
MEHTVLKCRRSIRAAGKRKQQAIAEKMVAQWLAKPALTDDPLLQLAGFFESDVTDVGSRHDEYIGQGLMQELRRSDNG